MNKQEKKYISIEELWNMIDRVNKKDFSDYVTHGYTWFYTKVGDKTIKSSTLGGLIDYDYDDTEKKISENILSREEVVSFLLMEFRKNKIERINEKISIGKGLL